MSRTSVRVTTRSQWRVLRAGPHVSVQDAGRFGQMRFGVPESGPMDRRSFAIAQAVLGNPAGLPAIEVSVGGLALECIEGESSVAVVGGGFVVQAGWRRVGSWSLLTLRAGDTLSIEPGPWGSWCYLAFAGALQAPSWLGSSATLASAGFGGGALTAGRLLTVDDARVCAPHEADIPCPVWARPLRTLACVLGPQDRFFDASALEAFRTQPFELTHSYDRMGVRLRGPLLQPDAALSIPSEPIVRGSVQVSGEGAATVLLADHQTTGGYPKIATLLSDEVDRFAQCRPRDRVHFEPVTPDQAVAQVRHRARLRRDYMERLAAVMKPAP